MWWWPYVVVAAAAAAVVVFGHLAHTGCICVLRTASALVRQCEWASHGGGGRERRDGAAGADATQLAACVAVIGATPPRVYNWCTTRS